MIVLKTARLTLRRLELADAEFILTLLNQPSFVRYIGDKGVSDMACARAYLENGPLASYQRHGFGLYMASLTDGNAPVGICGLVKRETLADVDVGFALLAQYESRGYATEAADAVLHYAWRECRLRRVVAVAAPDNRASIAVIEKIGMRYEGMVRFDEDGTELKLFAVELPPR